MFTNSRVRDPSSSNPKSNTRCSTRSLYRSLFHDWREKVKRKVLPHYCQGGSIPTTLLIYSTQLITFLNVSQTFATNVNHGHSIMDSDTGNYLFRIFGGGLSWPLSYYVQRKTNRTVGGSVCVCFCVRQDVTFPGNDLLLRTTFLGSVTTVCVFLCVKRGTIGVGEDHLWINESDSRFVNETKTKERIIRIRVTDLIRRGSESLTLQRHRRIRLENDHSLLLNPCLSSRYSLTSSRSVQNLL